MSANTPTQPKQKFRCRSTGAVLAIATHLDPNTGERVVLWEEIQAGFENAKSIQDEDSLVSFLRDATLKEIVPRRIAYHPGIVLDVILDDCSRGYGQGHGNSLSNDHNQLGPEPTLPDVTPSLAFCQSTTVTDTSAPPALVTLMDNNTYNGPLVPYSPSLDGNHSPSVVVTNSPSLQDIMSTFSRQIEGLQMQLAQSQLLQHDANNRAAEVRAKNHEEMRELQRRQQETADQLVKKQEELAQKQEEMNMMQKMALDRLANIQSRVQALVTQTYELHEYPIPRLFIVLPKNTGVLDKITNPFSQQFRLYFLCECGTHTMDGSSKTPHEIHLAKHEGYDLEKPNEFFERYGSYVLTLMNMIKYGVTAAGLIVPPLSGLKIVEGIDTTQRHMEYLKKNLTPLVDNTINFLEGIKRKNDLGEAIAEDHAEFEQLEALEGADLRQLDSYLSVKDKGRVLANLYRIVTSEGHVKWVCFDHYKATYRASAVQHLREIVEVNRGTFIEETGRIEIRVETSTLARQFYDAMVKARGIQELEITLQWDATMSDLRSLANAISKANVVHVAVDGSYFKSSPLDVVNRNQRFNPILQATSNSRIQSLRLSCFDGFFSRISKSALAPAPRLRVFKYDALLAPKDKDLQIAGDFLGYCSTLTTLELKLQPSQLITKAISEMLGKVQTLDSVRISHGNNLIIARITNGKICNVDLSVPQLGSLAFDDLKLIEKNYLTRLSINDLPWNQVERLAELLRGASNLKHLRIGCEYMTSLTILNSVIPTRVELGEFQTLESLQIGRENQSIAVGFPKGTIKDTDLEILWLSDLLDTKLNVIPKEHITRLSIVNVPKDEVDRLANVLRGASSLKRLQIGCDYESCLAILHSVIPTEEACRKAQALESLKIGNEELSITVSLSNGTVKDADLGIQRISDLIETSLKVIQKEHIVRLSIMDVQKNEVDQLTSVLRGASSLKHLRVGCDYRTSLTVVDSVISTRETIIQDTGSSCLQTFELMKEGLVPFSTLFYGYSDHIQSYVSFQEGSNVFDMRTWIRQSNTSALEFVRRYGWSIAFYDGGFQTNVPCSDILNGFGDSEAPQLERLRIRSSVANVDDLDQIVRLSPGFQDFGLYVDLNNEDEFKGSQTLLSLHAPILSLLSLWDGKHQEQRWEWCASSFPTRDSFPVLESFILIPPTSSFRIPSKCIKWIVAMVSAPPREPIHQVIHAKSGTQRRWTSLKWIHLDGVELQAEEWKSVMEAIDLSELQTLSFGGSNLSLEGLQLLIDRIPDYANVPLKTLNIKRTPATAKSHLRSLLNMLGKKSSITLY